MRDRLLSLLLNNLGTKLVSLMIAIVLWGIVLGSQTVEMTKEVPLEVITSPEVVASSDVPDHVSFRLAGPKALLSAISDRREDPIRVNLVGAKPGITTYRFFSDSIRLPIGLKVLSINPTAVLIKLEYLRHKEIPVKLELRGTLPEGYRIVSSEVTPNIVRIKGPESRVDSLTEIPTAPVDISDLTKSVDREVPVDLSRANVQLEGPLPHVLINVEPVSANFRINHVDIKVLSSYKAVVKTDTVTVLVRAAPNDLKDLDKSQVFGVVDLRGKPKGEYTEPVRVTLPDNISLVQVIPDRVRVKLE